jgi:hypothetical protein
VTTIGVALATFVGMLLGVHEVTTRIGATLRSELSSIDSTSILTTPWTTDLQWWAAGLYVLSLAVALGLWWRGGDRTDPAVSNLGKSFLGLVGGVLSVIRNLQ